MRAFHMNLQIYNANTAYPKGESPTEKHNKLIGEMKKYSKKRRIGFDGKIVDIAGFTEVIVADSAKSKNIQNALADLGESLNIKNRDYHIGAIRCGRTLLQDNKEVVGIVINGNATVQTFGVLYLKDVVNGGVRWTNHEIPATARYTFFNNELEGSRPDYRHLVYVKFRLDSKPYTVGFIHNRKPRQDEGASTMQHIRELIGKDNVPIEGNRLKLTLCGGDFNAPAPKEAVDEGPRGVKVGSHYPIWYYSPGKTTVSNPYDYWMSKEELIDPDVLDWGKTAISDKTPNEPKPAVTGSDHRGVDIEIR